MDIKKAVKKLNDLLWPSKGSSYAELAKQVAVRYYDAHLGGAAGSQGGLQSEVTKAEKALKNREDAIRKALDELKKAGKA